MIITEALLESVRLALRRLVERDLDALYDLESDEELKQYVGGAVREPRENWTAKMRLLLDSTCSYALIDRQTGKFAGRVSLGNTDDIRKPEERELQVILARDFVRCRLGAEASRLAMRYAFETLGATRLVAIVDARHAASLNLVERLRFREIDPAQRSDTRDATRRFAIDRTGE
jgi:RimJ/RimL family protein N-acetyltransferase